MPDAQVVQAQAEIRTTEDGRTVLVLQLADRTLAFPIELDEAGNPQPIGGCVREDTVKPDGTPHAIFHLPCLSVMERAEPPASGLTLLEGSGTDG